MKCNYARLMKHPRRWRSLPCTLALLAAIPLSAAGAADDPLRQLQEAEAEQQRLLQRLEARSAALREDSPVSGSAAGAVDRRLRGPARELSLHQGSEGRRENASVEGFDSSVPQLFAVLQLDRPHPGSALRTVWYREPADEPSELLAVREMELGPDQDRPFGVLDFGGTVPSGTYRIDFHLDEQRIAWRRFEVGR